MERNEYRTLFEQEDRFWWYRGLRRLVRDQAASVLAEGGAPPLILDAGCGTGGALDTLAGLGDGFGIDFHPLAVALSARRGLTRLCRGSVTALPYRDESFHLVVSLDVLYHKGVESDLKALVEFRRCLKPGGAVILNLPAFESLRSSHDLAIHTARRYRRDPLERLLREAGLVPERITYWNTFLFPALAAVRLIRRKRGRQEEEVPDSDVAAVPALADRLLGAVLETERRWLSHGSFPFGLSLLAVARRPVAGPVS